jgi:hypothetical protein
VSRHYRLSGGARATARAAADAAARLAARHTLDLARSGADVPTWAIVTALIDSGDLDPGDAPTLVRRRAAGQWELRHARLLRPASWLDVIAYCNPAP